MAMKRKLLAVAVVFSVAAVLLSIYDAQRWISPGEPIAAHAEIAADCFACHSPFLGSSAEKCAACHAIEDIGVKTTAGLAIDGNATSVAFHRDLIEADCVACHSDHRGVRPFRTAQRFSHELLNTPVRNDCRGCHRNPDDALHRNLTQSCGQCHGQERWLPANFDHSEYFRFDRHHRTACATCHVEADYRRYTCYGCHAHTPAKIREEHLEEGIRDFENCVECHRSGDEEEAEKRWKSRRHKSDN